MTSSNALRNALFLAFLAAPLVGCGGEGTTPDTTPTAPPVTEDKLKDLTKEIDAGRGGIKKAPGIGK